MHPHDSKHLYSSLRGVGLEYGPAFRLLDAVHTSPAADVPQQHTNTHSVEATSTRTPTSASACITPYRGSTNFVVHPAVLDCAFQLGAVVPASQGSSKGGPEPQIYVPARIQLFTVDCACAGNMGHGQVSKLRLLMLFKAEGAVGTQRLLGLQCIMKVKEGARSRQEGAVEFEQPHVCHT